MIDSSEARGPVAIERIPRSLQLATVAIEDQRFYEHGGIDTEGILRAAVKDLEAGEAVEGGSTITQQLVRNLCIQNPERNLERKIVEAKLARRVRRAPLAAGNPRLLPQHRLLRDDRRVDRGRGRGGVADLLLQAGLEARPAAGGAARRPPPGALRIQPDPQPGAGQSAAQRRCCARWTSSASPPTTAAVAAERSGLGLDVSQSYFKHRQPYFFDYVENELIGDYGVNTVRRGGLRVETTIDPELQRVGLEAMRSALPYSTDPASALVSIDPRNGQIRAMVSSSHYASSQFNLAAQGHRQPGSTFKAFVLTTAIKQGIDPYTTYYTSKPLDLNLPYWGHWEVHTADEGYQGTINLKQATVTSDNTVFAQLDLDVGPKAVAADGEVDGDHDQARRDPGRGDRRPAARRLAAGADRRLRDPRLRRHPPRPGRDPQGGLPQRPRRPPRTARSRTGAARSGRLRGDPAAARQHHRRHRHRRLHRLRRPGGQDRDHRRIHRRLVRRLPAQPGDRGLGRLPGIERDLDDQRARDHRLRRHLPGRNLALGLLRRRHPLRGIQPAGAADQLGPVLRPVHPGQPGRSSGPRRQPRRRWRAAAGDRGGRRL